MIIKMFTPIVHLFKELKNQPWTFTLLMFLVFSAYIQNINHAKAKDLEETNMQVIVNKATLDHIDLQTTAESIRGVKNQLCASKTPDPVLQRLLDSLQSRYQKKVGVYYPAPACS